MNAKFWKGKKVLVTGHTGFKGSWLSWCLLTWGADVYGYALPPNTNPNLFQATQLDKHLNSTLGDIRDLDMFAKTLKKVQPDIVFHLAAQPLVRYSYDNPVETYATNVLGTVHVLEAIRHTDSVKVVVNVTTDKCYENKEWDWGYRENDNLGGYDPYSNSKACAELVSSCYQNLLKNTALATARAGNVIGGGDWGQDRLIPDIVRALQKNEVIELRSPRAIRPWQHVLEPLFAYALLAEKLWDKPQQYSGAWNIGPLEKSCQTVREVVQQFLTLWGEGQFTERENANMPHEAKLLKLDISKAQSQLSWNPRLALQEALALTIDFYKAHYANQNLIEILCSQIEYYQSKGE